MIAIPALEKMRKAFKLSNMTVKERVLYFAWYSTHSLTGNQKNPKFYNDMFLHTEGWRVDGAPFQCSLISFLI